MVKKKKLIWYIFPSFLMITLASIAVVTFYSSTSFRNFFLKNAEKDLTIQAQLLQVYFTDKLWPGKNISADIDQLCKNIGKKTGTRITVILPSGEVIGDSAGNIAQMENHAKRPEIMAALNEKKGISSRYSSTIDKNMMYIALPVIHQDAVAAVVRTSVSLSIIDREIRDVRNNILIVMVFTILLAAVISLVVSRRITRPIEQMKKSAFHFSTGNLKKRLVTPDAEELSELAATMNQMAENLDDKIRDFKNRSMELEAVHSSMQEGVIAIDKNERIITINAAAARILDFPSAQVKSRDILEVVRNVAFQTFIQNALATHEPVEDDIVISRDQDTVLNIHSTALYDTTEKRIGTLIIFHDITRMRRLETLHKDFAANVSHELKTPLTSIKGFIETLQEMLEKQDTEQITAFLKIIEKNVNRMINLINDLLALSRLERMKGTDIRFERHSLEVLVRRAVHACKIPLDAADISVAIDCPENIHVMADPILMEQAIINLVDNAIKYSPEKTQVSVSATGKDPWVVLTIKDTGCGIDPEHLPKIFNRFYRVDKSRSRQDGGTGLGLAIVKHIIQYHKGKIEVASKKGSGTCFTISLPAG